MWMAEKSPSLSTNADSFPVWSINTRVELKRSLMPLEFKFAIVRKHTGFVVSLLSIAARTFVFVPNFNANTHTHAILYLHFYDIHCDMRTGLGMRHCQSCYLVILRIHFHHTRDIQRTFADLGQRNETYSF
jgi:hypothetical protein